MSLKDLHENSVTFDENNYTIKHYAKIKKMLIRLESKLFQGRVMVS